MVQVFGKILFIEIIAVEIENNNDSTINNNKIYAISTCSVKLCH